MTKCTNCMYSGQSFWDYPCNTCILDETNKFGEFGTGKEDLVSHPSHYISESGMEVKDVIKAFTENLVGFEAVCTGNVIKYICRWKKKNGLQDLQKAKEYLEFLIEEVEKEEK